MKMLVGGDDRRRDLGSCEQLAIIGGNEIGADFVGDEAQSIRLDLGESDEVDLGMPRCDLSAKQSDSAGADDGNTDALRILFHRLCTPYATARTFLASASGIDTGWLVSAERSAAM